MLKNDNLEEQIDFNESHDHNYFASVERMNSYVEYVTIYIAGFVAMKLERKIACDTCKNSLTSTTTTHESKLAEIKDRGGLKKPSKCLQTVCIESEKIFRQYSTDFTNQKNPSSFLLLSINQYYITNIQYLITCIV